MVAPPMELALFGAWCFLVAAAGGLAGLVLGNIRLPATLVVASGAASGAGANLAISAIAAATASLAHVRARRINWRLFAWMAPPSIAGALGGGYLAGEIDDTLLLAFIAAVLLYSAHELFRWKPREPSAGPGASTAPEAVEGLHIPAAVATGAIVGVLGGLVGLILGSLRMPALLRFVRETPRLAVGTNVAVGFCVGVAGALAHLPNAPPDLDVVLVGGVASIPGALVGSRLTGRLSEEQLVHAIAYVLVVAAAGCIVQAVR